MTLDIAALEPEDFWAAAITHKEPPEVTKHLHGTAGPTSSAMALISLICTYEVGACSRVI